MKRIIIVIGLLFLLISCNKKKQYTFIQIVNDESVGGYIDKKEETPQIIEAETDSIAYLDAYQKFLISKKMDLDYRNSGIKDFTETLDFKLINQSNIDIAKTISFNGIEKCKLDIENQVNSLESSISDINMSIPETKIKVDSSKVNQLKGLFSYKIDEFSEDKSTFVLPKIRPYYRNVNGFYFYFAKNESGVSNFRVVLQYHKDDWLFIRNCIFLIDGTPIEYTPEKMKTDNDETGITEWFDDSVNVLNHQLVESLANAKKVKIKLNGDKYMDVINLTPKQISGLKNTYDFYIASGGKFY